MAVDFNASARTWDSPERVERARVLADAIADAVPLDVAWSGLEVGCGTGQLTWHLGDRIDHVTLVDVAAGMLEVARDHAAQDPDRYVVVEHDLAVEPMPYTVDLVFSAMALHHIAGTDALLSNLTASLTPEGWIALADLDADPDNHFHDDDFTGHHGIDRFAVMAALRDLGYVDVTERTATTITKHKRGEERAHDVFLVTGRRTA